MKSHLTSKMKLVGCSIILLGLAACATSEQTCPPPAMPTPEQMKSIHECIKGAGISIPMMAHDQMAQADAGDADKKMSDTAHKARAAKKKHDHKHIELTAEQRATIDACFIDNGVAPPMHHHWKMHHEMMDHDAMKHDAPPPPDAKK